MLEMFKLPQDVAREIAVREKKDENLEKSLKKNLPKELVSVCHQSNDLSKQEKFLLYHF